jgi:hypothetical protein
MIINRLLRCCMLLTAALSSGACTTLQTTYFNVGYVELAKSDDPGLVPFNGTPGFSQTDDMEKKARAMYNEGFAMLGYSQFVSPLLVSLAPDYSTKYGRMLKAEQVVLENPVKGESNLHYFLATYWSRVRPEQFSFGGYIQNLPDDLLKRIGKDLNVVIVIAVVPGTPASSAGLRADDVILAVNGVRIASTDQFVETIDQHSGEHIDVSVSRQGKQLDLTVDIAPPSTQTMSAAINFRDQPWLQTRPTDWSALSAANITASSIAYQQELARQRELQYQRQQLAAQQHLNQLQSERLSALENTHRGIRRRGETPSRGQQLREYKNYVESMSRTWKSPSFQGELERQQKLDIWFNNAPNIYGQLFTFPMPNPM